jgi:WD40 repeat protein
MFHAVCYRPDECQIITAGTDRKIGYWETYDGGQIRELDGSQSAAINGMDICGSRFLTGGGDKLINVWDYDGGEVTHVGVGHSAEVSKVKVAPDGSHAVSVSVDGAILRWKMPLPPTNIEST